MPGTLTLLTDGGEHWEHIKENEDHKIETRLIGAEDIWWDSEGKGEKGSFVDRDWVDHPITQINASHIPLPESTRAVCGDAENVADGLEKLSGVLGNDVSERAVLTEDKEIELESSLNHPQKQALINEQVRNLGGHTLTVKFPLAIDTQITDSFNFSGFYNGTLIIDLQGIMIFDGANITKLFYIKDCLSQVLIRNGTLRHSSSKYAIYADRSPHVYLRDLSFIGSGLDCYAFGGAVSNGSASSCTYTNDKQFYLSGFSASNVTDKVSDHNSGSVVHKGILAPLASPVFTGTPKAPTPAAGDNSTKVATTAFVNTALGNGNYDVASHNASGTAHDGILAPLASPVFTGTPKVPTAVSGTNTEQAASTAFVKSAILNHDTASNAHEALFSSKEELTNAHIAEEISAHDSDVNAHSSQISTGANAAISAHNADMTAHAGLFSDLLPAGVVLPFAGNGAVPNGFLLCNGAAYSTTGKYSKLYEAIGRLYTRDDDPQTKFRVPDFRGMFLRGYKSGTTADIGTKQAESLPNITGEYAVQVEDRNHEGAYAKGAIKLVKDNRYSPLGGGWADGNYRTGIEFDASASNAIYGGSHVTPENYAVQYIIKY